MEDNPNYYSIIPANVRYDEDLTANEKLLFGEITALTNKTGECWASNSYFSGLYKMTAQSISRCLKHLKDKGYINIELKYKPNSKEVEKRIISIPININGNTCKHKCYGGININVKENNTSNNNNICPSDDGRDNNSTLTKPKEKVTESHFEEVWAVYPRKDGKNTAYKHYCKWLEGRTFAGKKVKLTERQMWYAANTYRKECEAAATEKQYIKMGSTFFNESVVEYVQKNEIEGVYIENEKNI